MKLALEGKGWQVDAKINLGGMTKCRAALEPGEKLGVNDRTEAVT